MPEFRTYGKAPYTVAVLHGGPGARGAMAPVAEVLSVKHGVIEPLQTSTSMDGQVSELQRVLQVNAGQPVCVVGSSWGGMLGFLLAARHPELVRKLILVGSGVFDQRYAQAITNTRMERLLPIQQEQMKELACRLADPKETRKDALMGEYGELMSLADAYAPLPQPQGDQEFSFQVFNGVWDDVTQFRKEGGFLRLACRVQCPVVAIHGAYDSHPADGVKKPLSRALKDFQFILLQKCGHIPWLEKYAREPFFELLDSLIPDSSV